MNNNNARRLSVSALWLSLAALPGWALAQSPAGGNPLDALPATPSQRPTQPLQVDISPPAQNQALLAQTVVPRQFDIVGVRSVPFEQVAAVFAPLAGQEVTLARIAETGNTITRLYQQAGYALSFAYVPPQDFANGLVRIVVVEGHIAQLQIEGNSGRSEALLRELVAPMIDEKPLRTSTFQRQTQLMARIPGVRVVASAQLPTTTDGATTLVLRSKYQPVTVAVGGDLRQSQSKAIATVTANDLLGAGSQLSASSLLRPWNEERFVSLGYQYWLNRQGSMLRLNASDYRHTVEDGPGLQGIDDRTEQRRFDVSIQHPLRLQSDMAAMVTGGMYGVNYLRSYTARATGASLTDEERVRVLYGQVQWSLAQSRMSRQASMLLAHGVDGLGARTDRYTNFGALLLPNPAKTSFWRLSFDAAQRNQFANGWGTAVSLGGQYSPDILPVSERISFGSSRFARGYQAGEAAGDSGLGAGLELNYSWPMQQKWLKQLQPYVLLEAAKTWQQQELVPSMNLRSASVGLRLQDNRYYSVDIALAKPLGDAALNNPDRNLRLSLLLSYQLDI